MTEKLEERDMHKWFHSFYCNEEILLHPKTGRFGARFLKPGDVYQRLHWFDTEGEAIRAIRLYVVGDDS